MKKFESFNYKTYLNKFGLNFDKIASGYLTSHKRENVVIPSGDKAFAVLVRKAWDKRILGAETYSIEEIFIKTGLPNHKEVLSDLLDNVMAFAVKKKAELLTLRVNENKSEYADIFERYGFITVDRLKTFLYEKGKNKIRNYHTTAGFAPKGSDYKDIVALARNSFKHSRIYRDKNIPKKRADKFYEKLAGALLKDGSNLKLIYKRENQLLGFAVGAKDDSLKGFIPGKIGFLWLITVDPKFRGQGLSAGIMSDFLSKFQDVVDLIEVNTQNDNMPAVKLYESLGLAKVGGIITMHCWRKK
ncbi:MAG: GNAT family N-acetyltransferase [Candidatus Omnitrophica bacterium]|nr:GNAT family N-acetyltransferase [Candidatus Omnitrophota bacterium]